MSSTFFAARLMTGRIIRAGPVKRNKPGNCPHFLPIGTRTISNVRGTLLPTIFKNRSLSTNLLASLFSTCPRTRPSSNTTNCSLWLRAISLTPLRGTIPKDTNKDGMLATSLGSGVLVTSQYLVK